ncbi:MAG: malto-oligosyltrehalose trehalohydrolase [Candidatus Sulfotelmatobacter sp.]
MKRLHKMPFGAQCLEDGSVRFRLWAPAAHKVELSIESAQTDGATRIPLQPLDQGWFELITGAAKPGSHYRFRINDAREVPDPASRFQPNDVQGPSEVVDPTAFDWQDGDWRGRPWEDAVIYELHVGTFTASGTFQSLGDRLDYLADVGVTAIELMPVADFPGSRNWGYDGVFHYAPDSVYGRPDDLKNLVQSAHQRGLMVLLDVVYNHFGPEGNYLNVYAPQFFTDRHHTPWGNAINFDGRQGQIVRDFFIQNGLYWLTEYNFDGLRLDAVHAIVDDSSPNVLTELAAAVHNSTDIDPERHVHLVLENDLNQARYLQRTDGCRTRAYTAQWNDDIHHVLHVLLTGERDGYYADYSDRPVSKLGRCLTEGFAYQGEASIFRSGQPRGEPSANLPPTAFISFLQNHDQVGNRAFGERITTLADRRAIRAAVSIVLLAPSPPLLFMGEEFGTQTPFLYFCDFKNDLAEAVAAGRRNEFARLAKFTDPERRAGIPDPNDPKTFESSQLNWDETARPEHCQWLNLYRRLLGLRRDYVVPHLCDLCAAKAHYTLVGDHGLRAAWRFGDGAELTLLANLSTDSISSVNTAASEIIYLSEEVRESDLKRGTLPPWSVAWLMQS